MSFFKKFTDKFEDMQGGQPQYQQTHNYNQPPPMQQQQQQQPSYQQYPPQQGQYPAQQQQYAPQQNYPPQQQWSPSPQPQADRYLPPTGPPPSLPSGWHSQWDGANNRAYYIEQATGRTQWEAPSNMTSPPPPPVPAAYTPPPTNDQMSRGEGGSYYGAQGAPPAPQYGQPQPYQPGPPSAMVVQAEKKDKTGGTGKLIAMGVGGAAVGALAGGLIAHEFHEDHDEEDEEREREDERERDYEEERRYDSDEYDRD